MARHANECDPDRAWVLRDLWTGAFDVGTFVPKTSFVQSLIQAQVTQVDAGKSPKLEKWVYFC